MNPIEISVIVPMYNLEEYISDAIESLLAQTLSTSIEYILVDDGSTDGTYGIASRYAGRDTRIKLFKLERNAGVASARNYGLQRAQGNYIAFLDGDDMLTPHALEAMLKAARHNGADLVYGLHTTWTKDKEEPSSTYELYPALGEAGGKSLAACPELNYLIYCCGKLFHRSLVGSIRFPEGVILGEDQPFTMQAYLRADKIYAVREVVYRYRQRQGANQSATQNSDNGVMKLSHLLKAIGLTEEAIRSRFRQRGQYVEVYKHYVTRALLYDIKTLLKKMIGHESVDDQLAMIQMLDQWVRTQEDVMMIEAEGFNLFFNELGPVLNEMAHPVRQAFVALMQHALAKMEKARAARREIAVGTQGTNDEMTQLQQQLKRKITEMIEGQQLDAAQELIRQYESIVPADCEIYTFKGIIPFMQGRLDEAEKIFKEGLHLNNQHFELLYNLGFISEQLGKLQQAYKYYERALRNTKDEQISATLREALERLSHEVSLAPQRRRVLIIAHIFPPVSGSGVQRTLKFVKYMRDFGWEPVVVTVGKTNYPLSDPTLLKEIPDDIEIVRVDEPAEAPNEEQIKSLIEAYSTIMNSREMMSQFAASIKQKEMNILQPDSYALWGIEVIKTVKNLIDLEQIDMLYSTSGPYTDHFVAFMLKQTMNAPWIADFRDEWTNNAYANYDKASVLYKFHYRMEEQIVKCASHVLTTTPLAADNMKEQFRLDEHKISFITNGYDEADFASLSAERDTPNDLFTVYHNGVLYSIRTPLTVFKAVHQLIQEGKVDRDRIRLRFTWTEDDDKWRDAAERLGIGKQVEFLGYLPHEKSLEYAMSADALLLILGPGDKNRSIYPGKSFEYLRLNKPIIALSPPDSLVEQLLNDTDRGTNSDFNDVDGIKRAFEHIYRSWASGASRTYEPDQLVARYERRNLTRQLTDTFNSVLERTEQAERRKKLCFFSTRDKDRFLSEIIAGLSDDYQVRQIVVTDYEKIDEGLAWADICWFEWCDDLLAYGSKHPLAKDKKIICRLHSYEAFTNNVETITWETVDQLILVSDSVKPILEEKHSALFKQVKTQVISNGVNLDSFSYRERTKGYNVAFVGYMIPHKNPMMLLQIARKLVDRDSNYRIYIAGEFRDEKLRLYWNHQLQAMRLEKHVIFQGYQVDMNDWLKDKHYLISATMFESFGYGIAEAMACGIKPVIHNYPYSEKTWPQKYLYNTIEEAVDHIMSDDYDSASYREVIQSRYSFERQLSLTKALLLDVARD